VAGSPVVVRAEQLNRPATFSEKKKGKPDPTPARTEKRTASRIYQLKSGHALTGVYLKSTENRPDDTAGGATRKTIVVLVRRESTCSSNCYKWTDQQAVMWARVKEATKRGKQKWRMRGAARRS